MRPSPPSRPVASSPSLPGPVRVEPFGEPGPPPRDAPSSRIGRRTDRRAPSRRVSRWLTVPSVAVALLVNLPLAYLFIRAGGGGLDAYLEAVLTPAVGGLLVRTLALVAGVAALTLALALPLAWLVTRTDLPGRRFWAVVAALPLVFPSYVSAFCLVAVLGPRGYLQSWLSPLGVSHLGDLAYGYSGALLALALFTYPYTYLLLVAALRDLDPALEESSRSLGHGRLRTFASVILPQLRPELLAGTLLVVLYTLSDFGAVSIARFDTFTLSIYNAYRSLFDRTVAASMGTVLVLLTLVFLLLEARLGRRLRPGRTRATRPPTLLALGRWRWPALAWVTAVALVTVALPTSVVTYWGVRALMVGNPLGRVGLAAGHSLLAALLAALVAVVLALPVAVWAGRHPSPASRFTERLSHAGFALPGIVIALSLVFFATRLARPLYQTLPLLVAAYVVRFLPQALGAVRSSLAHLAPGFEEAARSLGSGPGRVLATVTVPLLRPGLLAGAGLVFLTTLKELPATVILRPIGFDTLATRIWSAASEGIYSEAALPSLCLLVVSAVPVYWLILRPTLAER